MQCVCSRGNRSSDLSVISTWSNCHSDGALDQGYAQDIRELDVV